jgi:hypothetical protein
MDNIRQSSINSLVYFLTEQVFITKNKRAIEFKPMAYFDDNSKGRLLLDGSKEGVYQIYFEDNLRLLVMSNSDFNFKVNNANPSNSIILSSTYDNEDAILMSIKNLVVE